MCWLSILYIPLWWYLVRKVCMRLFFFFLDKNTDSGLHQPAVCIGAILYINTVLFVLCVQSLEGVLSATAVCDAIVSKWLLIGMRFFRQLSGIWQLWVCESFQVLVVVSWKRILGDFTLGHTISVSCGVEKWESFFFLISVLFRR